MAQLKDTIVLGDLRVTDALSVNTIKLMSEAAATSTTTGALVVKGGIATGKASFLTGSVHIVGSAGSDALVVRGISGCDSTGVRGENVDTTDQGLFLNINGGPVLFGYSDSTTGNYVHVQYTQDASSTSTGAFRVSGGVGIGKALFVGNNIIAGYNTAAKEIDIKAISNAGHIYLYSAATATGNRGIWLKNADATKSSALLTINQDNNISAIATIACAATITGTLTLSKTTDAQGTANNSPALIVGGAATSTHLEFDCNEIMAKATGTTVAPLYFNNEGGAVYVNSGYSTTSVSTAVDDSGLRVYARRAANKSVIDAYNGFAAASGTYSWGLNHLAPNIVVNANTCILTGVASSTNNQGVLEFHYAGSNNAGNYVGLGLYGNNGLLKIFKDKHAEMAGLHVSIDSSSNTTLTTVTANKNITVNSGTGTTAITGSIINLHADTIQISNKANNTSAATNLPYINSIQFGDGRYVTLNEYEDDSLAICSANNLFLYSGTEIVKYDATKTYSVGSIVWQSNNYWICKTAITTAEAWTSSHWTQLPTSAGHITIWGNLYPIKTSTWTLGTSTYKWKNIYADDLTTTKLNNKTLPSSLTKGGVIYASSTSAYACTEAGTSGYFLKSNGSGAPTWAQVSTTDEKVRVTTRGSTKAYILATTTEPKTSQQNVYAVAETGVYLDTSTGTLHATKFTGDGSGLTGISGDYLPLTNIPSGKTALECAYTTYNSTYHALEFYVL